MLVIAILVVGLIGRFIPHAPNFTPVIALAMFGGLYLPKKQAVVVPVILLILSDCLIGLHPTVAFTWGSMVLIALVGLKLKGRRTPGRVLLGGFAGALIFFFVTNFGVWLMYYPRTFAGLLECFTLAIPFLRSTIFSTLAYGVVFVGLYELLSARLRQEHTSEKRLIVDKS